MYITVPPPLEGGQDVVVQRRGLELIDETAPKHVHLVLQRHTAVDGTVLIVLLGIPLGRRGTGLWTVAARVRLHANGPCDAILREEVQPIHKLIYGLVICTVWEK